ncbi:MAG: VOC family protein [Opitutales bacterium]|nr:VOC family protein [Opitutales bacterium]NRA26872.1 VOC family protein [Opitutales bacterium]
MILEPWHFSWTVSDLEKSVVFYTELLGFELVHEQVQQNAYTEKLVGYAGAHLKVAMLKLPGHHPGMSGHMLELLEYVSPKGETYTEGTNHVLAAHLALCTDNIHAQHDRLSQAGVKFVSEPVALTAGRNAGGYACYFRDPDGFTLELLQPPASVLSSARVGETA